MILGLGGGWFEREHDAFGIDFEARTGARLDRLDEAAGLIRRLLDGERVTHEGRFYRMTHGLCAPRPIQDRLPILIGGSGPTKTLRTTARYADLWNGYGTPERIASVSDVLRRRCDEIGRPFEEIDRTVVMDALIRDGTREAETAFERVQARHGLAMVAGSDGTERGLSIGGPPDVVAAFVHGYEVIGVSEIMWIFRDPFDLETIERLGEVRALLG